MDVEASSGTAPLEILIPTYNRCTYLDRNVQGLFHAIRRIGCAKIHITISDNSSTDGTPGLLRAVRKNNPDIHVRIFTQTRNVGIEENILFCLKVSTSPFVIFTGDDDYLTHEYLAKVLTLASDPEVCCVLPAITPVDINGAVIGHGRDSGLRSSIKEGGIQTAIYHVHRGSSIAGPAFRREGTVEAYLRSNLRNIYPTMFFVGYNCKRGICHHLTESPVAVTTPPQSTKDWTYGRDGLYDDRFANTKALFQNITHRFAAERRILERSAFVFDMYASSWRQYLTLLLHFMWLKNATFAIKVYLIYFLIKTHVRRQNLFRLR